VDEKFECMRSRKMRPSPTWASGWQVSVWITMSKKPHVGLGK